MSVDYCSDDTSKPKCYAEFYIEHYITYIMTELFSIQKASFRSKCSYHCIVLDAHNYSSLLSSLEDTIRCRSALPGSGHAPLVSRVLTGGV